MKYRYFLAITILINILLPNSNAQEFYTVTSGEMIFSWADLELTESYKAEFPNAEITDTPPRWTVFFHLGQYGHYDFNNNLGFYSGLAIRNVGFISDEVIPAIDDLNNYQDYKIVRRLYNLGVPLALKIGSFDDNFFIFGGAEMEWGFAMKEKWWNKHKRDGVKSKRTQWFPDNTETFLPSVFGGVQLPGGLNIKFKYYLNDFIDRTYEGDGSQNDVSNLTRYSNSQTMYVSVSWQVRNKVIKKSVEEILVTR